MDKLIDALLGLCCDLREEEATYRERAKDESTCGIQEAGDEGQAEGLLQARNMLIEVITNALQAEENLLAEKRYRINRDEEKSR